MVLNVMLNLALMQPLGYLGMALSTSLAAWGNVAGLVWLLHRRGFFILDARLRSRLVRIIAACAVMSGCLLMGMMLTQPLMALPGWRIGALVLLTMVGMGTYGLAVFLTGAAKLSELKGMLRRRKSA
jgi:putative peptidoglycan lipid II flippase